MMKLGKFYRVGKFVGNISLYKRVNAMSKDDIVVTVPAGALIMPVKMEYAGVARVVYVKAMYGETMGWFGIMEDVVDGVGRSGFGNYFQEINSESDVLKY